jgi:hypothetical protein
MYVRRKAEIDLIDMGLENDELPVDGDQWWRIYYATSGSNSVTVEVGAVCITIYAGS